LHWLCGRRRPTNNKNGPDGPVFFIVCGANENWRLHMQAPFDHGACMAKRTSRSDGAKGECLEGASHPAAAINHRVVIPA
jgi:hypothetical protein